jgi:5-(aminomethyl)-3-furanmethanol phosphate kinase
MPGRLRVNTLPRAQRPWVVKLGGSLHDSPSLRAWLKVIVAAKAPIVVVPGGGPFADAVRVAQKQLKFSGSAAHRMALLAMEQYGLAMADMVKRLQPTRTTRSIIACLRAGRTPIWMPTAMTLGQRDIAESWAVTSDSLALWLAQRLGAQGLLLVKAARLPAGACSATELSRNGIIDPAFSKMLARKRLPCWCIGARGHAEAAHALQTGHDPRATSIELD